MNVLSVRRAACSVASTFGITAVLAAGLLAQPFPDKPSAATTAEQDRAQMLWQTGVTIPTGLPPRMEDPNRPPNGFPSNAAQPEGNWTDPLGQFVTRTEWGLWNNYDDDSTPGGARAVGGLGDAPERDGWQYTPIDLLKMEDGTPVTTPEAWWNKRRPEILRLVQEQLYGRIPERSLWPAISWSLGAITEGTANGVDYIQRPITGTIDTSSYPELRNAPFIRGTLRVPRSAYVSGKKVPVVIAISGALDDLTIRWGEWVFTIPGIWPKVAPTGFALCTFDPAALQPDSGGANLSSYIIGLINKGKWRKPDDWGALGAWSWGISRLIDFFEAPTEFVGVDPKRVGLEGHSRYGKLTIYTAAIEPRILAAYPSSSGSLGVKMNRRHWGQAIENSGWTSEYHWMAGNFFKYMGPLHPGGYKPRKLELLRVDAHSLVALAAPRIVFATAGNREDAWVDPRGVYLGVVNANPVYELLGRRGLVIPAGTVFTSGPGEAPGGTPPVDQAFIEGHLGFRRQKEGHVDGPGYPAFLEMAGRFFNDYTPPQIGLPTDRTVPATSGSGAKVTFSALAIDNVDDEVQVSFSPASGSVFPIGTTTVTATATDISGNTAIETFTVTVTPLAVNRAGYALNRRTNRVTQQVTLVNVSPSMQQGPHLLVLDELSSNTQLRNAAGTTSAQAPAGSPYVLATNATLQPGQSVTVTLQFEPPSAGGITYTPRTVSGHVSP